MELEDEVAVDVATELLFQAAEVQVRQDIVSRKNELMQHRNKMTAAAAAARDADINKDAALPCIAFNDASVCINLRRVHDARRQREQREPEVYKQRRSQIQIVKLPLGLAPVSAAKHCAHGISYENDDTVRVVDGGFRTVRSMLGVSRGAWFFEITVLPCIRTVDSNGNNSRAQVRVGFSTGMPSVAAPVGSGDTGGVVLRDTDGAMVCRGVGSSANPEARFGTGDTIGCLLWLPPELHDSRALYANRSHANAQAEKRRRQRQHVGSCIAFFKNGRLVNRTSQDLSRGRWRAAIAMFGGARVKVRLSEFSCIPPRAALLPLLPRLHEDVMDVSQDARGHVSVCVLPETEATIRVRPFSDASYCMLRRVACTRIQHEGIEDLKQVWQVALRAEESVAKLALRSASRLHPAPVINYGIVRDFAASRRQQDQHTRRKLLKENEATASENGLTQATSVAESSATSRVTPQHCTTTDAESQQAVTPADSVVSATASAIMQDD
ncbi:MAG: hypothetical protein MHM6MM_003980 [Cercozoa sp. M6MM]